MMLAKQSPWSIVYPTLVDVNAYAEKPSEELQHVMGCLVMKLTFLYLLKTFVHLVHCNISNVNILFIHHLAIERKSIQDCPYTNKPITNATLFHWYR